MMVDFNAMPGMGAPNESVEREFHAGPQWAIIHKQVVLVSTAVDARSSPTTLLQRGLLLGKITASGKYKEYSPSATDGSQVAAGILYSNVNMLDNTGTAADKLGRMVVWAFDVKATEIGGLDVLARRQLAGRVFFDDDGWKNNDAHVPLVVAKSADYTVTAADNNTIFTTRGATGAVNFTLPTLDRGLQFTFFNEADQNLTVTAAAADTMVTMNDLAADSVALQTASEKIGGGFRVVANDNETKWLVFPITYADVGGAAQTVTVAT